MNVSRTLLSFLVVGALAGQVGAVMPISKFEFHGEPENGDRNGQGSDLACKDILHHVNESAAAGLFLSSGLLAHESDRIRSVKWDTLKKELYQAGYMQLMSGRTGEGLSLGLHEFESQDWVLQRTVLFPNSYQLIVTQRPKQWLYRLVSLKQDVGAIPGATEQLVKNFMPTLSWFPSDATSWVGDDKGYRSAEDRYRGFQTGSRQWLIHDGAHYAIYQFTVAKSKNAAAPAELHLQVSKLSIFDSLRPTYSWVCSFRAEYRG